MVDINIANFITIGLMSAASVAILKFLLTKFGFNVSWI